MRSNHCPLWFYTFTFLIDLKQLMKGVSNDRVSMSLDIEVDWSGYEDWFGARQYETITSMTVDPKIYEQAKDYLEKFDEYFFSTKLKADEKKHLTDKWFAARLLTAIAENDTYHMLRHSDDSEDNDEEKLIHNAGRYYTCLTNMQGEVRRDALLIDGEPVEIINQWEPPYSMNNNPMQAFKEDKATYGVVYSTKEGKVAVNIIYLDGKLCTMVAYVDEQNAVLFKTEGGGEFTFDESATEINFE